MNLTQLTTFRAVMTSANLSDAAGKLGRTQPAVSASIRALEDQLGLPLFERKGRRMEPVPEAHYLLAEAEEILSRMDQARLTMRDLAGGLSGNLTVAAMPGPVSLLFPRFVAGFLSAEAEVKISLLARSSTQIAELVRAQSVDFGFVDFPQNAGAQEMYAVKSISGLCFVALADTHRLAVRDRISLQDLDNEPMGSLHSSHTHQKEVASEFARMGLRLSCPVESQTFLPLFPFVQTGRCSVIVDPLTVAHVAQSPEASQGVVFRPLLEPIRYRYAIISPLHRPASIIAEDLKTAWFTEVIEILNRLGAAPKSLP